jgi:hypothetical protein
MKLILTGANGFIGSEVLSLALSNSSITSLVALSRKPLPATHPKLNNVILKDFSSYPPSILSQLSGAEACIWYVMHFPPSSKVTCWQRYRCIGEKSTSIEVAKKVRLEYSMTAARTFSELAKQEEKKFRFVFLSGIITVRNQNSTPWFYGDARKIAVSSILSLDFYCLFESCFGFWHEFVYTADMEFRD